MGAARRVSDRRERRRVANFGGCLGPNGIGIVKDATAAGLYFLAAPLLFAVLMTFAACAALRPPPPAAGALARESQTYGASVSARHAAIFEAGQTP